MVHGLPEGFQFTHLKRATIINLIKEREYLSGKLSRHLDKTSLTYQEAVEVIIAGGDDDPIPKDLGDFILAAISNTIKRPILVVKPTFEKVRDVNNIERVMYGVFTEYLFNEDKEREVGSDLMIVVYNGLNHYAPATPKEIVRLTSAADLAKTQLNDAIKQVEGILDAVPPSDARLAIAACLKHMGAGRKYLEGTRLTTGTAVTADLPVNLPVPQTEASAATRMSRKRATQGLGVMIPEKKKKESNEEFDKRKKQYTAAQLLKMKRDTKCPTDMCVCGIQFDDTEQLENHLKNIHVDPKSWKCSECGKIYNSKGHCWSHVRKTHQGRFYHYCDVKYEDKNDIDPKTKKPKVKICDVAADELPYMEYHRETLHLLGHASVRCRHCDLPQVSKRRRDQHEEICKDGPTKAGEKTTACKVDGCDYKCRGRDTLAIHMKRDHPDEVGLPAPKRWVCQRCNREYKSSGGLRGHICEEDKPKKPKKTKPAKKTTGDFI